MHYLKDLKEMYFCRPIIESYFFKTKIPSDVEIAPAALQMLAESLSPLPFVWACAIFPHIVFQTKISNTPVNINEKKFVKVCLVWVTVFVSALNLN